MKPQIVTPVLLTLWLAANAFAAPTKPPKPISADRSANMLMDPATAEKIWQDTTPANVLRLYPKRRFRFVSDVAGGFNDGKTCVVTARAMLLPMQGTKLVYAPIKSATAFDAVPSLSLEQCQSLARDKLKEAIQSVAASLVAS